MVWRFLSFTLVAPLVVIATHVALPRPAAADSASAASVLAEIEAAWRSRQNRVQTAVFEWSEKRLFIVASATSPLDSSGKTVEVTVNGALFRVDQDDRLFLETEAWSPRSSDVSDRSRYRSAFNGKVSADCVAPGSQPYPLGTIFKATRYKEVRSSVVRPLLIVYRPLAPNMLDIDISSFSVLPEKVIVNGVPCVVLAEGGSFRGSVEESYYLDPKRDYLPLRFLETVDGEPCFQTEIEYRSDPAHGWVPSQWKSAFLVKGGKLQSSQVATVTSFSLNDAISASDFDITFPRGTWVRDQRSGEQYIIRPDGSRRIITPAELHGPQLTYEQLLSTESSAIEFQPIGSFTQWLIAINVTVVLLIVVAILFKRVARAK